MASMGPRVPRLQLSRLPHIPSQQALLLSSGRAARRRLGSAALASLAGLVLLALFLASRPAPRYVLVVDAGSSGTRLFAYTWRDGAKGPVLEALPPSAAPHKVPRRVLPGKRAYQRVETEPGLDQFVGDEQGLRDKALGPLLAWAEAVVPRGQWDSTPVFLFGTAGLRKLSEEGQGQLLAGVRRVLGGAAFRFEPPWARIISGADEGVYGWIALNYLEGRLQAAAGGAGAGATVGALDLGGSSLEVTFAADSVPWKEDAVNATLLGASHQLYSHVHHHYGLNDAFDRSVNILLARLAPPGNQSSGTSTEAAAKAAAGGGKRGDGKQQGGQQQQEQAQAKQEKEDGRSGEEPGRGGPGEGGEGSVRHSKAEQAAVVASATDPTAGSAGSKAGAAAGSNEEQAAGLRRLAGGAMEQHQWHQLRRRQSGRRLVDEEGGELPAVDHPCLHAGYRQPYRRLQVQGEPAPVPAQVLLVGRPDYGACRELAQEVVHSHAPCSAPPCALGTPQPSSTGQQFVALSGFYVVNRFFRLGAGASTDALEQAGRAFCGLSWSQVQSQYAGELMVQDYCFRAPYISALVRQGLLLGDDQLRIGSGDVGWTLGASLAEGYRLAGLGHGSSGGVLLSRTRSVAVPLLWLLGGGTLAALLAHRFGPASWRQHSAPLGRAASWLTGRGGVLYKLRHKGSAELISLGIEASPPSSDRSSLGSSTSTAAGPGLASLVYPGAGAFSSRGGSPLPTGRATARLSVRMAAGSGSGGTAGSAAAGSAAGLAGSPSWAALAGGGVAGPEGGGSGSAGPAAPGKASAREASYTSNLTLGRSRTFSRRSLATSQAEAGE